MKKYNPYCDERVRSLYELGAYEPNSVLDAAVSYHRMGLAVTPLRGKDAFLTGWQDRQFTEEELHHHFGNGRNVGIVLGGSVGLVDVDLDNPLAIRVAEHILPDTLKSGREKNPYSHYWYIADSIPASRSYALPKAMPERLGLDPGDATLVELRGAGRQTAVAPSVHPEDGDKYLWHSGEIRKINGGELEQLVKDVAVATLLALHWPPKGSRQSFALHATGYLGRRMEHDRVEAIVLAAASTAEDEEVESKRSQAVRDTLRKLKGGQSNDQYHRRTRACGAGPGCTRPDRAMVWLGSGKQSGPNSEASSDNGPPTHDELGDCFIESRENPTAYGQGEWHRYGEGYWGQVHQEIINREIDEILIEAKIEGIRPTSGMRASVERFARARTFVHDEAWDANPDILVCRNGTLEISNGNLREHRPEDYALGAVPYDFDPEAHAPAFYEFLMSTVPEAAPFLQEFAGYSLTVDTSLETAVWLYGPPGSGKSTFIEGLRATLGPRAGLLGLADIQRTQFALADLPGKTLVVATEQPADYIRSTDVLNAIISGEAVRVEQKYKPAYAVVPRAKVLWAMNDLPRIKDANSGLFRRVQVVPFPRLRVRPDPKVKERIKSEGPGILTWALEGLGRLRERGSFEIPEVIREATEEFRRTSDVPRMFVEEACITSDAEACEEQAQVLYEWYTRWCSDNGHKAMSSTAVAKEWRRLGFQKRVLHGRAYYRGVKVDPGWIAARDDSLRR